MGIERRKDRRVPFRMKVGLVSGRQSAEAEIEDVSFKGVFVRTDLPLPVRHLVKLRFTLPPDGTALELTGMVARRIPASGAARTPGAGIQLYGVSTVDLQRWNRFVRFVVQGALTPAPAQPPAPGPDPGPARGPAPATPIARIVPAQAPRPALVPPPPPAPAPPAPPSLEGVRRRYPRYAAALQVHLRTVDDLHTLYTRNVSRGGLFVVTALDLAPGTTVKVTVVHPRTRDAFGLEATVRWKGSTPAPGLGLEFTSLDTQRCEEFFDFIRSEVQIPVEELTYVPHDDPRLVHAGPREPGDPMPDEEFSIDEDADDKGSAATG